MSKTPSNKVDDKHERDLLNVINWQELLVFNLAKTFCTRISFLKI